jgi:hypothetical protein
MNAKQVMKIRAWLNANADWAALKAYRKRYIRRARRWVERDPARIDALARRLLEIGAYAGHPDATGSRRDIRYTILRQWCRSDGMDGRRDGRCGWHDWTRKHKWRTFDWMPEGVPNPPRREKPKPEAVTA